MSSRVRSDFGTLGERTTTATRRQDASGVTPRHVWVNSDGVTHPGLLVRWERREGEWVGLVAWAPDGSARVEPIAARWLMPA